MRAVQVFTDGACIGNPGPGGYGVVLKAGGQRKELSGGFRRTTNNRMELFAAIVALESLNEPCEVALYSDSTYMVTSYTQGSARRWQARGWMRSRNTPALNPDLWERLLAQCDRHRVEMIWIQGHAGHPENERCDQLSVAAAKRPGLPPDAGYEGGAAKTSPGRLFP